MGTAKAKPDERKEQRELMKRERAEVRRQKANGWWVYITKSNFNKISGRAMEWFEKVKKRKADRHALGVEPDLTTRVKPK